MVTSGDLSMYLILSSEDCARLRAATIADILDTIGLRSPVIKPQTVSRAAPINSDIDLDGVVDLTIRQVTDLVDGLQQKAVDGLRVFAEHGPVIDIRLLDAAGITSYGRFQAAVTRRLRTITGDGKTLLFGWDDWKWDETADAQTGIMP
jgi:hypothetical protein